MGSGNKALDNNVPSRSLWVVRLGGWMGWELVQAGLSIFWSSSLIAALEVPKLACPVSLKLTLMSILQLLVLDCFGSALREFELPEKSSNARQKLGTCSFPNR